MPRITPSTHHKRHQFLHMAWLHFPVLYTVLPLRQQWELHEFYRPSTEVTKEELVIHIKELAKTKPALVHQAGKHVRLMEQVFRYVSIELGIPRSEWYKAFGGPAQHHNPSPVYVDPDNGRRYIIAAVARSELDIPKLVKALVGVAKQETREPTGDTHDR